MKNDEISESVISETAGRSSKFSAALPLLGSVIIQGILISTVYIIAGNFSSRTVALSLIFALMVSSIACYSLFRPDWIDTNGRVLITFPKWAVINIFVGLAGSFFVWILF